MTPVGTRVVAVCDADGDEVRIFGRGVYAGKFPLPGSGQWSEDLWQVAIDAVTASDDEPLFDPVRLYDAEVDAGRMTRDEADAALADAQERAAAARARPVRDRARELLERMDLNPRIDLDDGGVVWGCECWWGPEADFDASFVKGRTVTTVAAPQR